jgi:rubrerythrin
MVSLVQRLRHWFADDPVVYECRNCGTTLDGHHETCPACDTDDVARYDLK